MAKREKAPQPKVLRVTLVKSPIGYNERQKRTVKALGLHKLNQTIEHTDSPALRGMLAKVSHLVRVEES
jgi:large subunit ribosomal protein L30